LPAVVASWAGPRPASGRTLAGRLESARGRAVSPARPPPGQPARPKTARFCRCPRRPGHGHRSCWQTDTSAWRGDLVARLFVRGAGACVGWPRGIQPRTRRWAWAWVVGWGSPIVRAPRFAASRTSLPAGPASLSGGTHSPRSTSSAARDHGSRRPTTGCAGRSPRFVRTGQRRAISLSEAHLQAARRDARHTIEREAEGVLHRYRSVGHRGAPERKGDTPRPGRGRPRRRRGARFRGGPLAAAENAPRRPPAIRREGPCCKKVRRCTDLSDSGRVERWPEHLSCGSFGRIAAAPSAIATLAIRALSSGPAPAPPRAEPEAEGASSTRFVLVAGCAEATLSIAGLHRPPADLTLSS